MYNRKTHLTAPAINEGYESDVDVINDGRRLSAEINSILSTANSFHEDFGIQNPPARASLDVPPTRNPLSHDNLSKTHLSGIPEEMRRDMSTDTTAGDDDSTLTAGNNAYVNLEFQNMSLSNFRKIQGNNVGESPYLNDDYTRKDSHASIIQMKDLNDGLVHTGRNFRKLSTFVITPNDTGDDRMNIKLIESNNVPDLFIQMDCIKVNETTNRHYWIETYRWLKFEEDYNCDTEHFNTAHLSPLTIRSITDFKNLFSKGQVILDSKDGNFGAVLNTISVNFERSEVFTDEEMQEIRDALVLKHYNAEETLGLIEYPVYRHDRDTRSILRLADIPMSRKRKGNSIAKLEGFHKILSNDRLEGRLEPSTESLSVHIGALDGLQHTFTLFIRLNPTILSEDINEVTCPLRFLFVVFGPKAKEMELMEVGRVFSSMMSNVEFREVGYSANSKEDLLEATKRFVAHSVLVCPNKVMTHESLYAMYPQMRHYFHEFMTEKNQKLFSNMKNEMLKKDHEITLNNIENGAQRRISISAAVLSQVGINKLDLADDKVVVPDNVKKTSKARRVIMQFCPPMRYFIHDWRGFGKRFVSDFRDAFTKVNAPVVFVGFIFIYFVVMTPAITFGALLNAVNPKMTITMMLLASGFFQLYNTLFGGHPFEVVGITGPIFAAEKTLGVLAVTLAIDLGAMRLWIGVYIAILGIVFTVFNGVIIIKHMRRSVEEIYNFLVAAIYVMSAIFNMFIPLQYAPLTVPFANGSNINVIASERLKVGIGGTTLFLAFFMTNFCLILIVIKKGTFYRRTLRKLMGSLNVPLGIILIIAMARIFFSPLSLPTLNVPASNNVNFSLWFNIPTMENVFAVTSLGHGFCFLIAISIFSTMTCEVACNGIMASKAERKLLKPSLFTLNFFNVHVIFPLISGILGWPFISGGTVRSHIHCLAMSHWSLRLPGVPPKIVGAAEQRMSGSLVGLLVFLSVFFGSALQQIPMAALFGMFIFMGIVGVLDLVFIRRFVNLFRRRKYWKAHEFLKDFPTWNISVLVSVQLFFIAILIILNCVQQFTTIAWAPLLYAPTIGAYALVRGYILPRWKRLNTHLSKMDKKHPLVLYADLKNREQVIVTVEETGVNVKVVQTTDADFAIDESEEDSDSEDRSAVEAIKYKL